MHAMTAASTSPTYLKGAAFGLAAMSIWAGWSAMTRLAVTTNLDALDVAALRFGVAGVLLAPVVMQRGLARDRLGWLGLVVMIAGIGAPYVLVAAGGLRFAPASDQGALNPGCMPLFVALIAATVLGESILIARGIGLALILAGALVIVGWHGIGRSIAWSASRSFGDALFPVRVLPDRMLYRSDASGEDRPTPRGSPRLHRIARDLSADLFRGSRNTSRGDRLPILWCRRFFRASS
jgi:hypothetical protein